MSPSGASQPGDAGVFRVLSLDGGGAKGFYTLGILEELEALLGGNRSMRNSTWSLERAQGRSSQR